jgi:tetratricopeptide (TPR) repeat protein
MARLEIRLVCLLLACSAGHTQSPPDAPAVSFFPQPLSKALLPVDPTGGKGRATAQDGSRHAEPIATREELSDVIERRLAELDSERSRSGERSPALIGDLASLAAAYQELGQYDSAIAALQDAIGIARINFGLHSIDQAGAVESLVAVRQAKGEQEEAAQQREYLRELVRRNGDDSRVVGILKNLAASEMQIARRFLGVAAPPQVVIRTSGFLAPLPLSPQSPSLEALYAARSDYSAAMEASVRTSAGNMQDVFDILDLLADTVYFEYAHPEVHGPDSLYRLATGAVRVHTPISVAGLSILQTRLHEGTRLGRAPIEIAQALLEVGDWHLLYNEFGLALDRYEDAHGFLVEIGVPAEAIEQILSPEIPPTLPVRNSNPPPSGDRVYRGYIRASVEITRFGFVKRVDILDESAGTSRAIERSLRRWLSANRFRPRFVDGELAGADTFDARFYFDY